MDKKIVSVMANVASLEKTMTNIQLEVSSLKVRADSAETKYRTGGSQNTKCLSVSLPQGEWSARGYRFQD